MGPLHSAHPFPLTHDPKPTIVLIPEAWFPSAAYAPFLAYLEQRDFAVEIFDHPSLALPPQDASSTRASNGSLPYSVALDAESLRRNLLHRLFEREGKDVVLLAHGYGCRPALTAAKGLHKATRFRQDLAGGVVGVIGVAPVVLQAGAQGMVPEWVARDHPQEGYCLPENPKHRFAHDCSGANAQAHLSQIRPFATSTFESVEPVNALGGSDYDGCLAAILAADSRVNPLQTQESLIANSGKQWMTHRLQCSHSAPFLDRCAATMDVVESMVEAFEERLDEQWLAESRAV